LHFHSPWFQECLELDYFYCRIESTILACHIFIDGTMNYRHSLVPLHPSNLLEDKRLHLVMMLGGWKGSRFQEGINIYPVGGIDVVIGSESLDHPSCCITAMIIRASQANPVHHPDPQAAPVMAIQVCTSSRLSGSSNTMGGSSSRASTGSSTRATTSSSLGPQLAPPLLPCPPRWDQKHPHVLLLKVHGSSRASTSTARVSRSSYRSTYLQINRTKINVLNINVL